MLEEAKCVQDAAPGRAWIAIVSKHKGNQLSRPWNASVFAKLED